MTLKEFAENYIEYNSLVRVLYREKGGHRIVLNDWDDVDMNHQIVKCKGKYSPYVNHKVIGVTSISVRGNYSEAVNVVIEEIPLDELRDNKIQEILK